MKTTITFFASIPFHYLWWGLGAISVIILITIAIYWFISRRRKMLKIRIQPNNHLNNNGKMAVSAYESENGGRKKKSTGWFTRMRERVMNPFRKFSEKVKIRLRRRFTPQNRYLFHYDDESQWKPSDDRLKRAWRWIVEKAKNRWNAFRDYLKNRKKKEKTKEPVSAQASTRGWKWLMGTTFLVTIFILMVHGFAKGIKVVHGLTKGTNEATPWFQSIPSHYWLWGIGIIFVIAICWFAFRNASIRKYGKNAVTNKWFWCTVGVVGSVVLLAIIWKSTGTWWDEYSSRSSYRAGSARSDQYLPTKDVLQIIAECESRGRQFNADGSLVRNPDPKSTAIGKFQIVASLHEESAKRMGYDIRTEAGNEAYATHLYERDGLRHWEATRYCWGPKLPAGLYNTTFSGVTISTRVVRVDKDWSEWVKIPTGQDLYYERMESVAFEIETMGGKSFQFPRDFRGHHRIPRDTAIRFRVTDASVETMPMWLRFSAL